MSAFILMTSCGKSGGSIKKRNSGDIFQSGSDNTKVLIVYFTAPEDVSVGETDADAGASVVSKNGEVTGNTEYVARLLKQQLGGDMFRIETEEAYPLEHDDLVEQASDEQKDKKRPKLLGKLDDLEKYDTVILGFPNWWGDMPMPVYTFLEQYDLGSKTIIPFVTHGGSGFSDTVNTISKLQPDAVISDKTLSLSRNDVADSDQQVKEWADSLGIKKA